ncbi:HEAT, type 2 [Plasmopara halstedii]|uniref:HEAT, type 2 n=1 Tax=Plasmopara halstedii TaxID=4781 RepID=A0A0P1AN74_PLAHL|nr:HEAT, type 2 [Plasmopara halstedii]CEG42856.1 HEAT, type 2 [Plasmopara halstedii]|eukprot:XP_024579225.1 HEAT, type 2 [Plasmopara halstedii]
MEVRNVDALWQEMAKENNYDNIEISRLLSKSMAAKSVSSKTIAPVKCRANRESYSDPIASSRDDYKSEKDVEAINVPKILNHLAAEQRSVRKNAAFALENLFLNDDKEYTGASNAFAEMAKPLFKRFNDPMEKVRDVCIRITTKFIVKEEDLLHYLPYLMSAITNRINSRYGYDEENQVFSRNQYMHEAFKRGRVYVAKDQVTRIKPNEPSEEIRLLLLSLVDAVLRNAFQNRASSILHAYIFDVILVLISGVQDDYHEVNITSCRILASISNHMVSVMKHFSVATIRSLMPLLLHRLARVRVVAVETIRALVTCPNVDKCKGSGTEAIVDLIGHREENVIPVASFYTAEVRLNYFAKLDQDQAPMVRRAFFAMISDWMINLPDRYDHESRLLPYLLSAVSDEDSAISKDALETLKILGERYEGEHEKEVLELKQYGADGKNPTYNYEAPLPVPFFAGRPSLGTRLFVRGRARRFLNPILRELANWQDSTRSHAVRLLKCVLVYCEETITVDAHLLTNTLLRVWNTHDKLLPELMECADLTGRFVAPKTYLPLLFSHLRGDSDTVLPLAATSRGSASSTPQLAVALQILHCMLQGSLDKTVLPHVSEILEIIALPSILDHKSSAVKSALGQLLSQVTMLLERRGFDAVTAYFLECGRLTSLDQIFSRLFDISVVLKASSECSLAVTEASCVLKRLKVLESLANIGELYNKHGPSLLQRSLQHLQDMLAVQWSPYCAAQLAFQELIVSAPVALLLSHGTELNYLFETIQESDQASSGNDYDSSTIAAQCARKQNFDKALMELVKRVQAELEIQNDSMILSAGNLYMQHWTDLLIGLKA